MVVIGSPLRDLVASEANVTTGNVSALAGPGEDRRLFQMTAPVQPGNSGGPMPDTSGHAVGVTVSKLHTAGKRGHEACPPYRVRGTGSAADRDGAAHERGTLRHEA